MKKVEFFSKWLDDSNESIKERSNNTMESNKLEIQKPTKTNHSTAGLLACMAKGIVSFLQNLLSSLSRARRAPVAAKKSPVSVHSKTRATDPANASVSSYPMKMPPIREIAKQRSLSFPSSPSVLTKTIPQKTSFSQKREIGSKVLY